METLSCARETSIICASILVFCGIIRGFSSALMSSLTNVKSPAYPSPFALSFLYGVLYPINSGVVFPVFSHVSLMHMRCVFLCMRVFLLHRLYPWPLWTGNSTGLCSWRLMGVFRVACLTCLVL